MCHARDVTLGVSNLSDLFIHLSILTTMNSSTEHGSPESSSSGEDTSPITGGSSYISNFGSHVTTIGNLSGPSKRRLPQGSSFEAASTRVPKTRRRERERERERGELSRPGHTGWEKESGVLGKKELKDDLLDQSLVEHLRQGVLCILFYLRPLPSLGCVISIYENFTEIGDPFLEFGIKG